MTGSGLSESGGDRRRSANADGGPREGGEAIAPPRRPLPAAAASNSRSVSALFLITLLSTVDGSLLVLAASGRLSTLGGAVAVGLTVIAGAGSWLAAQQAFAGRRPSRHDALVLSALGVITLAATVASVWLGLTIGQAVQLHVLPKAGGVALVLVAAEVAGLRVPRIGRVPAPLALVVASGILEVASQWIPSLVQ